MSRGQFAFSSLYCSYLFFSNSDNWCLGRWEEEPYDQLCNAVLTFSMCSSHFTVGPTSWSHCVIGWSCSAFEFLSQVTSFPLPVELLFVFLLVSNTPVHCLSLSSLSFLTSVSTFLSTSLSHIQVQSEPATTLGIKNLLLGFLLIYHQLKPTWLSFCSDFDTLKIMKLTSAGPSLLANNILLVGKKRNPSRTAAPHLRFP